MQIAGSACKICERNIVLALDGKFCLHCSAVVHRACDPRAKCHVCGQAFQGYERPSVDPIREAIVPRALRGGRNASTAVALLCAGVAGIIVILCYVLMEAWSLGH